MNDFLRLNRDFVPTALKGFFGQRLHGTFALLFNELADGVRQAVRQRVPSETTPADALPFMTRQVGVPWFNGESEASYRSNLRAIDGTTGAPGRIINDDGTIGADSGGVASGFWKRAVERGSPKSVEAALLRCGINAIVEEVAEYDPGNAPFFRYRVRLPDFVHADCQPYLYGEAPPYGAGWHYGTKVPFAIVNTIFDVHRFYAPARSKLEDIVCGPVPLEVFVWTKFTVTVAELFAAALTNDIELFVMPEGDVFHGYTIKHTTAFSGGAITEYLISLGVSGELERYASEFDVFQAVGATVQAVPAALACVNEGVATSVRIAARSVGGNLDTATLGAVDIDILTSTTVP